MSKEKKLRLIRKLDRLSRKDRYGFLGTNAHNYNHVERRIQHHLAAIKTLRKKQEVLNFEKDYLEDKQQWP